MKIYVEIKKLEKLDLPVPPDIQVDYENAIARVQALHETGASKAAQEWCIASGMRAVDPFLGEKAGALWVEMTGAPKWF